MRFAVVLALLALFHVSLAHGAGIEVIQARLVTMPAGSFLEATFDVPDTGERHDLLAVSTRRGAAVLEQERAGAYRPVDAIPVGAGREQYGARTPYRIRVPRPTRGASEELVTVMFGAGELVHANAAVVPTAEGSSWPARRWVSALLVLGALGVALRRLRRRRIGTS